MTDVIERSGILPSSPLLLTLASVRFVSWPLLAKEMAQIHDALRDVTPYIHAAYLQATFPGVPSPQPMATEANTSWLLLTEDKAQGIQFSSDQVLFYARAYTRYTDFERLLRRGLDALMKSMKFMHVSSAGVRYVDLVRPRTGESPDQYVAKELLTPSLAGLEVLGGVVGYTYRIAPDTELRVRSVCHPQALAVPDDLIPTIAIFNHLAQSSAVPQIRTLYEGEILLDFDAVKASPSPVRINGTDNLLLQLNQLHTIANNFFRNEQVCKDFAFRVWQKESAT